MQSATIISALTAVCQGLAGSFQSPYNNCSRTECLRMSSQGFYESDALSRHPTNSVKVLNKTTQLGNMTD